MSESPKSFEQLVEANWTLAVFEATHRFERFREDVYSSLKSSNPEVRSAAVATFIEANDPTAHDEVVALAQDENEWVRHEVLEYLNPHCQPSDVPMLLQKLDAREEIFLVITALNNLVQGQGPIIDDDHPEEEIENGIKVWHKLLRELSHVT